MGFRLPVTAQTQVWPALLGLRDLSTYLGTPMPLPLPVVLRPTLWRTVPAPAPTTILVVLKELLAASTSYQYTVL